MNRTEVRFWLSTTLALLFGTIGYGIGALTTPIIIRSVYIDCNVRDVRAGTQPEIRVTTERTDAIREMGQ